MSATWIVTANRTGARIIEKRKGALSLVEAISHGKGASIEAHASGASRAALGGLERAVASQRSPHESRDASLVREVAQSLRNQRALKRFDRLVLVAEPRLLGALRAALDPATSHLVSRWMAKDVQDLALDELGAELPPS
jgi:protein required for attachment to host cells